MARRYRNIARVTRTHGSKGEVVAEALRGLPFLLEPGMTVCLTPPALRRERFSRVESVRAVEGDAAIVSFSCARDLGGAEGIVGSLVLAERAGLDMPPRAASYDELIGRRVEDARFGDLGLITEIMETPANDVWVLSGGPRGEVLIPVIDEVVPAVPDEGPVPVRVMDGLL